MGANTLYKLNCHHDARGRAYLSAEPAAPLPSATAFSLRVRGTPRQRVVGRVRTGKGWGGVKSFPNRAEQLRAICAPTTDPRPLLYDLFCKAGGATKGYQMAGFRVVGVDIEPQKNYCGDGFIQMDALEFLERYLRGAFPITAAFHASPPCQRYSEITPAEHRDKHPDLIAPIRTLLKATGKRFIIENVPGAKKQLKSPIKLCGSAFGLGVFRHRYFELGGFDILMLTPCRHDFKPVYLTGSTGNSKSPKGTRKDFASAAKRQASGIDWMVTEELDEAIPPAFTEFIGKHLMDAVRDHSPHVKQAAPRTPGLEEVKV